MLQLPHFGSHKGVFIAAQLNSTQLNSTRQREQQLTQFVGRDVINKNTTDLTVRCSTGSVEFSWVQLSWVELYRYKHPLRITRIVAPNACHGLKIRIPNCVCGRGSAAEHAGSSQPSPSPSWVYWTGRWENGRERKRGVDFSPMQKLLPSPSDTWRLLISIVELQQVELI